MWTADTIDSWMRSEGGEVADILSQLLSQERMESVAGVATKSGAIGAQTLSAIIQNMSDGQVDGPREDIEASIQAWRVAADLAVRLNCPYYQNPDTYDHYRHFCVEPTVVAAKKKHKELLTAAIYACELKTTTAKALTAMYMLDTQGRHMDPGATEDGACENLVDGLIHDMGGIQPAKAALVALLSMGPSERTHGWLPKNFEHGMRLLGEPLKKVRTFQVHVVRLVIEAGMWAARCRVVHPNSTRGLHSRKKASDEYTCELNRSGEKEMPITRRFYEGLPPSRRAPLLAQWNVAFPAPQRTLLDNWM